jgi:transposase InsO family protein
MPFQECSIVSQREEFCRLGRMAGANIRELCRRAGVSPGTGYKWLQRFDLGGAAALTDRSRRPLGSPGQTAPAVEALVLAVRREHPAWGGRKIHRVLRNEGLAQPPAASTITAILRRHGLLDGPRAGLARDFIRFEHPEPNDLWQMDFKGHFGLVAGRCHPLTVLDDHSRYCLELRALDNERTTSVQDRLEAAFRQYGLPRRILADNGAPWGTGGGPGVHTLLSVWLMDLDVRLIHGRPYHPQTQGKDERFHRTLKAEVLDGRIFHDLDQAQAAFDHWRQVYNTRRPHQALDMNTPASRYSMSRRSMPQTIAPPDYESQAHVRTVAHGGWINFKGRRFNCSQSLGGRKVALRATDTDGLFDLCYRRHVMAQINLSLNCIKTVHDVPEHPSTMSPV